MTDERLAWPEDLEERLALARRILRFQPDLYAATIALTREDLETLDTALTEYHARRTR